MSNNKQEGMYTGAKNAIILVDFPPSIARYKTIYIAIMDQGEYFGYYLLSSCSRNPEVWTHDRLHPRLICVPHNNIVTVRHK